MKKTVVTISHSPLKLFKPHFKPVKRVQVKDSRSDLVSKLASPFASVNGSANPRCTNDVMLKHQRIMHGFVDEYGAQLRFSLYH